MLLFLTIAIGCGRGEEHADIDAIVARLSLREGSFEDVVPEQHRTLIGPREQLEDLTAASGRDAPSTRARTLVDATSGRALFPMPREPREFQSRGEMLAFMVSSFGADEVARDEAGAITGASGSYSVHGIPYFEDARLSLRFRVRDPLLAYTAGVRGIVRVDGEDVCVDTDGECATEYASYLEPVGELTYDKTVTRCNVFCMTFESFWNRTFTPVPFPFWWARHGSNISISVSPLPETELATGGTYVRDNGGGVPDEYFLPMEMNSGEQSVEAAVWTALPDVIWFATATCGGGMGFDPDIGFHNELTSDGPDDDKFCW